MLESDASVERARAILRVLVGMSGMSRREVRRRLAALGSGTDVTRLLGGTLDLKLRHIVDILDVIEVHPLEFFQMTFPPPETPRRSPVLQMLEATLEPGKRPLVPRARAAEAENGGGDEFRYRFSELMRELAQLMATSPSRRPEG